MICFGLYLPLSRELLPIAPSLLALHLIINVPEIRATHWGTQFNIRSIGLCLHYVMDRDKATLSELFLEIASVELYQLSARLGLIFHVDALLISLLMTSVFN